MDVSLVVPMMNEEDGVRALFQELIKLNYLVHARWAMEAVLVDDGSTDRTFERSQEAADLMPFPVKVIRLNPNEGIGGALRQGIRFAVGRYVVTYDADLPYPIEDTVKLLCALDDGADVASASPYHPDGRVENVPFLREWISRTASGLWRARLGRGAEHLKTLSCGFRAYRRDFLDDCPHRSNGFLATTEILVRAVRSGRKVVEIPSVLRNRATGRSKMKVARTALAHLSFMLFRMPKRTERTPQ